MERLVALLADQGERIGGFVTRERREEGRRVGFCARTFDGREALIAHEDSETGLTVGRYGVDVTSFERLAVPVLSGLLVTDAIAIVDEIARMELASASFVDLLVRVLERPRPLVATVHVHEHAFTDGLLRRPDVQIIEVTEANRDELPAWLAARVAVA